MGHRRSSGCECCAWSQWHMGWVLSNVHEWVHFNFSSLFKGVIAVGLFADNPIPLDTTNGREGFFKSGDWYLLGVQALSALCLTCWGICSTFILLYIINIIVPIRMDPSEELVGADLMEHRIRHSKIGISRAISALSPLKINLDDVSGVPPIGQNPGKS